MLKAINFIILLFFIGCSKNPKPEYFNQNSFKEQKYIENINFEQNKINKEDFQKKEEINFENNSNISFNEIKNLKELKKEKTDRITFSNVNYVSFENVKNLKNEEYNTKFIDYKDFYYNKSENINFENQITLNENYFKNEQIKIEQEKKNNNVLTFVKSIVSLPFILVDMAFIPFETTIDKVYEEQTNKVVQPKRNHKLLKDTLYQDDLIINKENF